MRRTKGFTIVELMITIAIMAILAAIAIPNYRNLVLRNAVEKTRDDLYADFVLARSEALARSRHITICPTRTPNANIQVTLPTCATTDEWNTGWIIFQHVNPTASGGPAAVGDLIRVHANLTAASTSITFNGAQQHKTFDRLGRILNVPGGTGDFGVCNNSIGFHTAINIGASGRPLYQTGDADLCK